MVVLDFVEGDYEDGSKYTGKKEGHLEMPITPMAVIKR